MVELSQNCSLQDSGLWCFNVNRHKAKSTTQYQITHTHAHRLQLWLLPICLPLGRTVINHCGHNQTCWLTTHGCAACARVSCTRVGFCAFPVHLCVCEWVDGRLELTQHDFSADLMRETAKRLLAFRDVSPIRTASQSSLMKRSWFYSPHDHSGYVASIKAIHIWGAFFVPSSCKCQININ